MTIKILLLEGPDRVGKSAIMKKILEKTNKYIIVHRFAASQWVYRPILNKNKPSLSLRKCLEVDSLLIDHAVYVFLVATAEDLKHRKQNSHDKDIKYKNDMLTPILFRYNTYFEKTSLPVIWINTSMLSIDQTVTKILKAVKKYD